VSTFKLRAHAGLVASNAFPSDEVRLLNAGLVASNAFPSDEVRLLTLAQEFHATGASMMTLGTLA
jgi:hypothetical protein